MEYMNSKERILLLLLLSFHTSGDYQLNNYFQRSYLYFKYMVWSTVKAVSLYFCSVVLIEAVFDGSDCRGWRRRC